MCHTLCLAILGENLNQKARGKEQLLPDLPDLWLETPHPVPPDFGCLAISLLRLC